MRKFAYSVFREGDFGCPTNEALGVHEIDCHNWRDRKDPDSGLDKVIGEYDDRASEVAVDSYVISESDAKDCWLDAIEYCRGGWNVEKAETVAEKLGWTQE